MMGFRPNQYGFCDKQLQERLGFHCVRSPRGCPAAAPPEAVAVLPGARLTVVDAGQGRGWGPNRRTRSALRRWIRFRGIDGVDPPGGQVVRLGWIPRLCPREAVLPRGTFYEKNTTNPFGGPWILPNFSSPFDNLPGVDKLSQREKICSNQAFFSFFIASSISNQNRKQLKFLLPKYVATTKHIIRFPPPPQKSIYIFETFHANRENETKRILLERPFDPLSRPLAP